MTVVLAGVGMDAGPDRELTLPELSALARLRHGMPPPEGEGFTLQIRCRPEGRLRAQSAPGPAEIGVRRSLVTLRHRDFEGALDVIRGQGVLRRDAASAFPLESTLRTALCCRLPLQGGVALHAAGVVVNGSGLVFFGASGAGKSTLSATSSHPVVSDELVAVAGEPFELRRTGFWGTLDERDCAPPAAPLAALVELAKGPRLELEPLDAGTAFRRLLPVLVLPPAPVLWRSATAVVRRLVESVPVLRMAWHPTEPPWAALETWVDANHGLTKGRRRMG